MAVTAPDPVEVEPTIRGWRVFLDTPRILTTPTLHDGRLFIGGGYGSTRFYAFDLRQGTLLWQVDVDDDGPSAAVAVEDVVAFNTESCTLFVLEAATGRMLWSRWLGDPLMSQPAADRDRLWMAYPASDGHRLACFALRTGAPLWEAPLSHDAISAPVLDDEALYVSTFDGRVWCFGARDGRLRWTEDRGATSAPWIADGRVYVSQHEDMRAPRRVESIREYDSDSGRRTRPDTVRLSRADYLKHDSSPQLSGIFDTMDTEVGFKQKPRTARLHEASRVTGQTTVAGCWAYQGSRPCVVGGRCYSTVGDELTAVELAGGRGLWRFAASPVPGAGRLFTPPILAGDKLFVGTVHGRLRVLEASTGVQLWRYRTRAPIRFQPAVWEGCVAFGNDRGEVVCLSTGDPRDTGWPMWGGGPAHNGSTVERTALARV